MDELAQKINEEIKKSNIYKNYVSLKEKIENDSKLVVIKDKLESIKKETCKSRDNKLINEYYELEKEYKNNIIVKEYLKSKEELNDLLKDIVDILSLN